MDWRREGDILEQILALLVGFAALADCAAAVPLCLALPALAFLTHAEDVAQSCLCGMPAGAPAFYAASRSEDRAERLAAEFRALARILRGLIDRARLRARLSPHPELPFTSPREPVRPHACLVPAPDTS